MDDRQRLSEQSSMTYWWPLVRDLPIPQPKTLCVPTDHEAMFGMLYDKPAPADTLEKIRECCDSLGYPAFIRTDQLSGKHDWNKTCYLERPGDLGQHLYWLADATGMADIMGDMRFEALFVREFLRLRTAFRAFSGGMPINREVRCFVRDGSVECLHEYWFAGVFEEEEASNAGIGGNVEFMDIQDMPSAFKSLDTGLPADWRERLREINTITERDGQVIREHARMVGRRFPGEYWSVDFAQGRDGTWYLIDMARGEISFHLPGCARAPEDPKCIA